MLGILIRVGYFIRHRRFQYAPGIFLRLRDFITCRGFITRQGFYYASEILLRVGDLNTPPDKQHICYA